MPRRGVQHGSEGGVGSTRACEDGAHDPAAPRIFARLREGWSYGEIAAEEGVTITWVRQIVADVLEKRSVDSGAEHAKLQLERLAPAMQLAADAISAIALIFC